MKILNYILLLLAFLTFVNESSSKQFEKSNLENIKESLIFLSSDSLMGREPGTTGGMQAAKYIADKFQKYGLKSFNSDTISDNNSEINFNNKYFRYYKISINKDTEKSSFLEINNTLLSTKKWRVLPISSNAEAKNIPIVFAGFGITAKDMNYDDYSNIDANGKAVIVLSDSSLNGNDNYNFLSNYSSINYKIHNAKNNKAKFLILIKRNNSNADDFYPYHYDNLASSEIPVIQITRSEAKVLFPELKDLDNIENNINLKKTPNSFEIKDKSINFKISQLTKYIEVPNIVGYVEGINPKFNNEYIVVGAHFDHLGMGKFNSLFIGDSAQVHNGADDNASGTSAIIELSRIFSAYPAERNIIFVAFNNEESGLIGSSNFVKNSPVPLNQIVTMINYDMIGRLVDNKLSIMGVGTSKTNENIIDEVFKNSQFSITKLKDGFAPSDQTSFYAENIPVMMFFTGVHSDYHTPFDDYEKINFKGMNDIINYSEQVIRKIANSPEKPDFINTPIIADQNQKPMTMGSSGVWFGIVPNFAEDPKGMPISGASEGSPAQKIGLKNGDIITEFAGKKMNNLYDLTYTLRELKPGDKVLVKYIRDNKSYEVECTLAKRKK